MGAKTFSEYFALLVQQHLTQALWLCGYGDRQKGKNLDLAKMEIALLEAIELKTQGNLTDEEERLLRDALHEARMAFVRAAHEQAPKKVDEAPQNPPTHEEQPSAGV